MNIYVHNFIGDIKYSYTAPMSPIEKSKIKVDVLRKLPNK